MATDFWASTHYKRWIVDRATLIQARADDLRYVESAESLEFLSIFFANLITKLAKKLQLRQRAIATAIVFFKRFYLKNSYCETDPYIVIVACCYVAGKAEESPVHIKQVLSEARALLNNDLYEAKLPADNSKVAEMEFYLVDELECDLVVFHPYRTLLALCTPLPSGASSSSSAANSAQSIDLSRAGTEAGELLVDLQPPGQSGKLAIPEGAVQLAWFVLNDTYRSDLPLLYPPHLLAVAALTMAVVLHGPTREAVENARLQRKQTQSDPQNGDSRPESRRSTRSTSSLAASHQAHEDPVAFLASLNVSMPLVASITQEILSLYARWEHYSDDGAESSAGSNFLNPGSGLKHERPSTPMTPAARTPGTPGSSYREGAVTQRFLATLLRQMRAGWAEDLAHPSTARPIPVNKMLERTRAGGMG